MSKLRYRYFTVWKTKMERSLYYKEVFSKKDIIVGKVTVAFKELFIDAVNIRIFELGFAFCSRHDNFSRVRGRLIASGRLSKKTITITISLSNEPKENFHERLIENIKDKIVFLGNEKISWMKGLTTKNIM